MHARCGLVADAFQEYLAESAACGHIGAEQLKLPMGFGVLAAHKAVIGVMAPRSMIGGMLLQVCGEGLADVRGHIGALEIFVLGRVALQQIGDLVVRDRDQHTDTVAPAAGVTANLRERQAPAGGGGHSEYFLSPIGDAGSGLAQTWD